jgi:hypothetical protein
MTLEPCWWMQWLSFTLISILYTSPEQVSNNQLFFSVSIRLAYTVAGHVL